MDQQFKLNRVNKGTGTIAITISEKFAPVLARALYDYQNDDGSINGAASSLSKFVRDASQVIRGEPMSRFPILAELDEEMWSDTGIPLVVNEPNETVNTTPYPYADDSAPVVEDTAGVSVG